MTTANAKKPGKLKAGAGRATGAAPPPDPGQPSCVIHNSDCIAGMFAHQPEAAHLIVTSIPFEDLFVYSGKPADVGNNGSTVDLRAGRFALNLRFVVDGMFRLLKPGCNCCVHIQQLLAYKNQHGFMGRRDFRGSVIDLYRAGGFQYVGEAAIPKDPQRLAEKLQLHSLQFKSGHTRNGCLLAPAPNDYLLVFQKPGDHPDPPRPIRYRDKNPGGWVSTEDWVEWAKGTWETVLEIDVLDGGGNPRTLKKYAEAELERHVCPLQLEVIRRCVALYTAPGQTVCDPFMGIGSTAWVALDAPSPVTGLRVGGGPRNVVGWELKDSYHAAAVAFAKRALKRQATAAAGLFAGVKA